MHRATWKNWERFWAHQLGGVRVPVSGRARGDTPDVSHPLWAIEVKAGRVLSPRLRLGMRQAIAAARNGQTPLLCISHTSAGRPAEHYVMLRLRDWLDLHGGPAPSTEELDD
jgi:hypothetical protein